MIPYSEYKRARTWCYPEYPAHVVVAILRAKAREPFIELNYDGSGDAEMDGFDIHVSVECDEWNDLSHLGELKNKWAKDAIDVQRDLECGTRPHHGYLWYHPMESLDSIVQGLRPTHGKHDSHVRAWEQIRKDYKALTDREHVLYLVRVTASKNGIELATNCLGGMDVESMDDPCIQDELENLVPEAIAEAKEAARKLVAALT